MINNGVMPHSTTTFHIFNEIQVHNHFITSRLRSSRKYFLFFLKKITKSYNFMSGMAQYFILIGGPVSVTPS